MGATSFVNVRSPPDAACAAASCGAKTPTAMKPNNRLEILQEFDLVFITGNLQRVTVSPAGAR